MAEALISVPKCDIPKHATLKPRRSASLHKELITKLRPLPFQYVWSVYYDRPTSSSYSPSSSSSSSSSSSFSSHSTSSSSSSILPVASNNRKSTSAANYTSSLTTLAPRVPDIAEFYKVFNNIPWSDIRTRDSVHLFRAGVQPVWEDPQNLDGGCFTLRIRKTPSPPKIQLHRDDAAAAQAPNSKPTSGTTTTTTTTTTNNNNNNNNSSTTRAIRIWEEICLLGCGGELQAALAEAGSRDHVLGLSFSPRPFGWVHIKIWIKNGGEETGRRAVQRTVLERLSPELRLQVGGGVGSSSLGGGEECYYRKHSEHDGWEEAVEKAKRGAAR